jgi:hypothetical protein
MGTHTAICMVKVLKSAEENSPHGKILLQIELDVASPRYFGGRSESDFPQLIPLL